MVIAPLVGLVFSFFWPDGSFPHSSTPRTSSDLVGLISSFSLHTPQVADIENLAADKYGQKVLMHLLAPRSPKYLIPDTIKFLEMYDRPLSPSTRAIIRSLEAHARSFMVLELRQARVLCLFEITEYIACHSGDGNPHSKKAADVRRKELSKVHSLTVLRLYLRWRFCIFALYCVRSF